MVTGDLSMDITGAALSSGTVILAVPTQPVMVLIMDIT
jgi:hypothetical protein